MRRFIALGVVIGATWALFTSPVLLVPSVRESVRLIAGYNMTFLLPLLPVAWVAAMFGSSAPAFGVPQVLLLTLLAGAAVGALVGLLARLLRR